jgi:pimeloyl-ACP methyl ester carboxylesterase
MSISDSLGEVKELTVPAGTIRYRERGSGPTLVFAHGAIANGDKWRKVVPGLADDYRCITPDWPLGSHELAMKPDADLTPPGVAQIMIDFVEALGEEEVTLISNDTATALAQLVLVENPRRITRAVLTHGDLFKHFFPTLFKPLQGIAYIPGALHLMGLAMRPALLKRLGYLPITKTLKDPAILASYADPVLKSAAVRRDLGKFLRGISSRHTVGAAPKLSRFRGPVLLVWIPEDKLFPLADAERLVQMFDLAQLVTIRDSRTFIPEDQPEALVETLRKFLRESEPGGQIASQNRRSAQP